jgi:hypothetical protein
MVSMAESAFSEPVTFVSDDTVLDEVNFAGLIINKLSLYSLSYLIPFV